VLDADEVFAGFGNPTVVFVASVLVVASALEATGVSAWAGQLLVALAGPSRGRLTVLTMCLAALLTAVITVHGAVAALIPVVVATAMRLGVPTSRLLMPLAFAAHAGSQLSLAGSQVNILFSEAAHDAGAGSFEFFEYALVGVPLVAGTVVIVALLGPRLLPDRPVPGVGATGPERARGLPLEQREDTFELAIPPWSALIGTTVGTGRSASDDASVVLVVHRDGTAAGAEATALEGGDVLLVRGDWRALADAVRADDAVVVAGPEPVHPHVVPWGPGAGRTMAVLLAFVALLATGAVPPAIAGVLAVGALVCSRVLAVEDVYRGVTWTTVVLIAAMIPLSTAMTTSGAADDLAEAITGTVGDGGPYVVLAVLFVVVAALGQLMSNTATALVAIPVAIAASADLDVSVRPVLMSVNVVTVAALLTPVATAANTMVLRPGGYRFGDYARLGLPLLVWWFVVAVGLVPLVWRF